MAGSSQKFIGRNRAPRVQIEYEVEVYGSQKKIQLPFVMGVMSDLSGKSEVPLDPIEKRKYLEINTGNFDARLKAMQPRVAFNVENTLTGEGNFAVALTFESMDDFSPAAIARKVEALNQLLEARTQLKNLTTFMDGKTGAEELLTKLLHNPALLQAVASGGAPAAPNQEVPKREKGKDEKTKNAAPATREEVPIAAPEEAPAAAEESLVKEEANAASDEQTTDEPTGDPELDALLANVDEAKNEGTGETPSESDDDGIDPELAKLLKE